MTLEDYVGVGGTGRSAVAGGARAQEHPGRQRHFDRQDYAGQRLLAKIAKNRRPVLLIEDTRLARRSGPLRLRFRPDRISIGEVRGAGALDLLKAWGARPGGGRGHGRRGPR